MTAKPYATQIQLKCDALILGGGLGSRMGYINKALVNFKGQSLFSHVLNTLESLDLDGQIYLSLNQDVDKVAEIYPRLKIFSDDPDLQQLGPLGGLLSFYRHFKHQSSSVFVCPCDTPFISKGLIEALYQAFTACTASTALNCDCPASALGDSGKDSSLGLGSGLHLGATAHTSTPINHIKEKPQLVCAESEHGLEPSIMLLETAKLAVIEELIASHEKLSLKNLYATLNGHKVYFASTQDFYNINTLSELNYERSI